MNLQSGKYYWQTTYPNPPVYPSLEEDILCDVLIVGGGSSGAQCAYLLSDKGLKVAVVDKRRIGTGSTMTNTALLQYLGDKMLFELINSFGEESAIYHTKLCEQAISEIEETSKKLNLDSEFTRRDSLYYASDPQGETKLQREYDYLIKHDFPVDLLNESQIKERYPFSKQSALYIHNDGEINPFKYNHGLIQAAHQKGVQIFEDTKITGKKFNKEYATFFTDRNHSITARKVIIAAGYEGLEFKKDKDCLLTSSYAVITKPVENLQQSEWYKQTLIWETARPYIYMRTTADNRIIIGGLDENTIYPEDRDSKINHKKTKLIEEFNKLFPGIKAEPEFYLGAFYGGTHDGLPLIGQYDEFPHCHFQFAYGDNGLVYSTVLSKIITDIITKGSHPAFNLYSQKRRER
ncbi:FAD-dependent oxidoreductase [Pradoshia sp. D12]|uniref:NAD(P)/FAD-dependent oxidoreductase n=1 Tax=Bacillaceae TaxID=186817 RepID=UPI00112607A3|nr:MULTISPECIES: FAD-dependent oxidoreductase [Bacillaceae]QFK72423.1 FAD-dependent oxidoreductase [Pradoshia sp. D12]TPF70833.1 FAD-dependent oxidoreductase [Bacillus sp. D12]